jgi:hypothetical protein
VLVGWGSGRHIGRFENWSSNESDNLAQESAQRLQDRLWSGLLVCYSQVDLR